MSNVDDPLVKAIHLRKANLCARGSQQWFDRYGLDFRTFLRDGYPASVIEATGDALGFKVAGIAREDAKKEQG